MKKKEFIKAVYYQELELPLMEAVEKYFPELVKKSEPFKNGDILKSKYHIIKITDYEHKRAFGFNFYYYVDPKNPIQWSFITDPYNWEKVDISVWKERLIEECKKRGIWDNPDINSLHDTTIKNASFIEYYNYEDDILSSRYGWVYRKGVFATPIETITKLEAEKQLGKKIID